MCRLNSTCSLVQKCHSGVCEEKNMCAASQGNATAMKTQPAEKSPANETYLPVKSEVERQTAKAQVDQLREHLDVTAMFLG